MLGSSTRSRRTPNPSQRIWRRSLEWMRTAHRAMPSDQTCTSPRLRDRSPPRHHKYHAPIWLNDSATSRGALGDTLAIRDAVSSGGRGLLPSGVPVSATPREQADVLHAEIPQALSLLFRDRGKTWTADSTLRCWAATIGHRRLFRRLSVHARSSVGLVDTSPRGSARFREIRFSWAAIANARYGIESLGPNLTPLSRAMARLATCWADVTMGVCAPATGVIALAARLSQAIFR